MPSSFSEIMREIVSLKFIRGDNNKIIVNFIGVNMRQMQRMRFNWKHFDEMTSFQLIIGHRPRKLSQYHEIQLLNYLECRPHAYLNEMV